MTHRASIELGRRHTPLSSVVAKASMSLLKCCFARSCDWSWPCAPTDGSDSIAIAKPWRSALRRLRDLTGFPPPDASGGDNAYIYLYVARLVCDQ